jgi:hypothetical protein
MVEHQSELLQDATGDTKIPKLEVGDNINEWLDRVEKVCPPKNSIYLCTGDAITAIRDIQNGRI